MANILEVAMQHSIITLFERGHSRREIAKLVGVNRRTVTRYVNQWLAAQSKCTGVSTGSDQDTGPNCTGVSTGSDRDTGPNCTGVSAVPDPVIGPRCSEVSVGSATAMPSRCEPFRDLIAGWVETGLTAQRIYQDLTSEHGFSGGYKCVQRFVRKMRGDRQLPHRRMECGPGREVQVDFGRAAPTVGADGRRTHPHLFRVVLSHSRKAYSEVVPRQTTEHFIRALENAFRHFGGITETVVIDNLRAAVQKADWYEPELHPKIRSFCEHYGTVILPAKARRPELKGKVERGVAYVKSNALKGRRFSSIAEQNAFLLHWENHVADTRIHGTTRQQVGAAFEVERPFLRPLPPMLFPSFAEGRRIVHRDQHIEVETSYYSVPPEYARREVWVRYDTATVKIYGSQFDLVAGHARVEPGGRSTLPGHIPAQKISGIERGEAWQLKKAAKIGPHALGWARAMLQNRGIEGIRVLQGLINLPGRHRVGDIDTACEQALTMALFRLRDVKELIRRPVCQLTLGFLTEHHLIRDLTSYGTMTPRVFGNTHQSEKGTEND